MLAAFKRTATFLLTTQLDDEEQYTWDIEPGTLTLNVDEWRSLVAPYYTHLSWHSVSNAFLRTTSPLVQAVQRFHDSWWEDMDSFARTMVEIEVGLLEDGQRCISETAAEESYHSIRSHQSVASIPTPGPPPSQLQRRARRRRTSDPDLDDVLSIPSRDPSIPTIIITPCPTLPRDRSCLVPYQDVSFGTRLAVPMHPVVNDVFPPLLPKPVPYIQRWRFKDGHWWAVLPTPDEQMLRGMFSRPLTRRRRTHPDNCPRLPRTRRPSLHKTNVSHIVAA